MKKVWRGKLAALLMLSMVCSMHSATVLAKDEAESEQDTTVVTEFEKIQLDTAGVPDNEELLERYIEEELESGGKTRLYGNFGMSGLTGRNKEIYNALKKEIEKIASDGGSTKDIEVKLQEAIRWSSDTSGKDVQAEVKEKVAEMVDMEQIVSSLLADCPSTFYWYDKEKGIKYHYEIAVSGNQKSIEKFTIQLSVAAAYRNGGDPYSVNAERAREAAKAVAKADQIVEAYRDKSDFDKLKGYLTEICKRVSYNEEAVAPDYQGEYGDPWQMIYVFDGDPGTNVVCEGYAKAFQYLCDKSSFRQNVTCYTVTGDMTGGTGEGGHMWNVVSVDGRNYIVDVTNCDSDTIGAPDKLFMKGCADGDWDSSYTFRLSQNITYKYHSNQKKLYGKNILKLSETDYTEEVKEEEKEAENISLAKVSAEGTYIYNGTKQIPNVKAVLGGKELDPSVYFVSAIHNKDAGTASFMIAGEEEKGYIGTARGTFEIQKAELAIENVVIADKKYDDTTDAEVSEIVFRGLQGEDRLVKDKDYTVTAAFSDSEEGTDKDVTVKIALKDTAVAKNYRLKDSSCTAKGRILEGITEKTAGTGQPKLSASEITYGQKIGEIILSGTLHSDEGEIEGAFQWDEPEQMPQAGKTDAAWTFVPHNKKKYETAHGTTVITVRTKELTDNLFEAIPETTYNGSAHTPDLAVKENLLTADDYEIVYENNRNAGTADIIVKGKKNYSGEVKLHFTIMPAEYNYSIDDRFVQAGSSLKELDTAETASGVNGEKIKGTLKWYQDENLQEELNNDYVFSGPERNELTLYWAFTPEAGQNNYTAAVMTGNTTFKLQGNPVSDVEKDSEEHDDKERTTKDPITETPAVSPGLPADGKKEEKTTEKAVEKTAGETNKQKTQQSTQIRTTVKDNTSNAEKAAKTGDENHLEIWIALLVLAMAGGTGICAFHKKKR